MTRAACFRCDWQGETSEEVCPRCGTRLYRAEAQRRVEPAAREVPPGPTAAPSGEPSASGTTEAWGATEVPELVTGIPAVPDPREEHRGRRVVRALSGAAVLPLVVAALLLLGGRLTGAHEGTHRTVDRASHGRTPGTVVYAAADRHGRQRLWRLDLGTGEVVTGPTVPTASALHMATSAGPDWVGVDSPDGRGRVRVLLLPGMEPSVEPRLLGRGDLAAWAPFGGTVAIARHEGKAGNPCGRLVVSVIGVQLGFGGRVFETDACVELAALGRDQVITYLELVQQGRPSLAYVGESGVPHDILHGYKMVSASPSADFLVTSDRPTARGAALFWRGRGSPVALGDERHPLILRSVVAWALDGSRALVVGRLGDRRGLFEIAAGPGTDGERRVPTFVGPSGAGVAAAYAEDGTAFVVERGRLMRYAGGTLSEVPLPDGAPPPFGPLGWVP